MGKYSDYKGVAKSWGKNQKGKNKTYWVALHTHRGATWRKHCETEREAALAYDKRMIDLGLEPVNVLKRK